MRSPGICLPTAECRLAYFVLAFTSAGSKDYVVLRDTAGNRSGSTQPLSAYSACGFPGTMDYGVAAHAPVRRDDCLCVNAVIFEPEFRSKTARSPGAKRVGRQSAKVHEKQRENAQSAIQSLAGAARLLSKGREVNTFGAATKKGLDKGLG